MRGFSFTPSRTMSAPTPFGPPNLCALTDTSCAGRASSATSSQLTAWTASVCNTAWGACWASTSATSAKGWMTPLSLFTSMTDTNAVFSSTASASSSKSSTPRESTPTVMPPSRSTGASTAGCSIAEQTMRFETDGTAAFTPPAALAALPPLAAPDASTAPAAPTAPATPKTARLSASVAPLQKTISPGFAPQISASKSRASFTARMASRAIRCAPDGLA